jgi:hypothetical protein
MATFLWRVSKAECSYGRRSCSGPKEQVSGLGLATIPGGYP